MRFVVLVLVFTLAAAPAQAGPLFTAPGSQPTAHDASMPMAGTPDVAKGLAFVANRCGGCHQQPLTGGAGTGPNQILHAASFSMLKETALCKHKMFPRPPPSPKDCDEQNAYFAGASERDLRDVAAYLSSAGFRDYVIEGRAPPGATMMLTSSYLPNTSVVASSRGVYRFTGLAAGEYNLRASKPGVAISPGPTSLLLDHYNCAAPGAAPLPPPNIRKISELNFKTAGML